MPFDPNVLTWKDWILVGWAAAMLWNSRSRRSQGERLGTVERAVAVVAKAAGVDLDEESNPGQQRRRKPPAG